MSSLRPFARAFGCAASARVEELSFAARAWLIAPIVRATLAAAGLKSTMKLLKIAKRLGRRSRPRPGAVSVPRGREWTARALSLQPLRGECLERSLVQHTLHALDGTASRLVVGIRREPNATLEAHAWVTHPSDVDPELEGFRVIFADDAHAAPGGRW